MNEQELIELIQNQLPEDLTGEQIAEIRSAMRTSPLLRDALLAELSLEQGLATKFAPGADGVDEIVGQILRRASARRRMHWFSGTLIVAVCLAAIAGGGWLAARVLTRPAADPADLTRRDGRPGPAATQATTNPAGPTTAAAGTAVAGGGGATTTGPATQPEAGPLAVQPVPVPVPGPATEPATGPATQPAPGTPPPAWALFEQEPSTDGRILREAFRKLFKPLGQGSCQGDQRAVVVRGRFALDKPLAEGQLLRLALYDQRQLAMELWRGQRGVRFALRQDGPWSAAPLTRAGGEVVAGPAILDRRWSHFHGACLDLRYQAGRAILACADVFLLSLPLDGPPDTVSLEGDFKLAAFRLMPCGPIRPPLAGDPGTVALDTDRVGDLKWSTEFLQGAQFFRNNDGSADLLAKDLKQDAAASTPLAMESGRDVCILLRGMTHRAGVFFRAQTGKRGLDLFAQRGRHGLIVWPWLLGDDNAREAMFKDGLGLGETYWVRLRVGFDQFELSVSPDGRQWRAFPSQELDPDVPIGSTIDFGLILKGGEAGQEKVGLAHVRVVESHAMDALAEPQLVKLVPDGENVRNARSLEDAAAMLAAARPADAEAWKWRLACDAALLRKSQFARVRRASANDLLATAAKHLTDVDKLQAAGEEYARFGAFPDRPGDGEAIWSYYDNLAQACFASGHGGRLAGLVDSWCDRILPTMPIRDDRALCLPPALPRLMLYDLLDRRQWDQALCQAGRMLALHRPASGDMSQLISRPDGAPLRLAQWAQALARGESGHGIDESTSTWEASWSHPLTVRLDRETLNVISEFVASVEAKAYEAAAKVLATETLPDGLVPTGADGQLYQAIHFRIRQLIQTHAELAKILREKFAPMGAIRLQRALRDGDVDTLQSLAVQFHGTAPARTALCRLADRDLSMGDVFGAAAKYKGLLETAEPAQRDELAAKYRLASALAGLPAGQPVTADVDLPGKRMTGQEFEAMIASLLKARATGGQGAMAAGTAVAAAALAPAPGKCETAELCPVAADGEDRDGRFTRHVAWAAFGRNLLIQQRGKLSAVNLDIGAVLWSQREPQTFSYSSESAATPWPIVAGGRAYLRLQTKREPYLACYDLKDGKCIWRERYDEGVLSDPILVNNWLYVLSYRSAIGGQATIYLRRVSPESGQSALAARLVVLRRETRLLDPGRLVLAGDSLLFRCAGALVCCDLLGEVQWIRRLAFVPPEVDAGLMNDLLPGAMILRDSGVILAAPACPAVQCVDVRTGRMVWSCLQPQLRRVVGLAGPAVVLATEGYLEALDAETGKLLWRCPIEADAEAVLPAEGGTVLCVTMDEPPVPKNPSARGIRRARWLSGKDGSIVRTETLDASQASRALIDATAMFATGKELIGLANYDPKARSAKVFTMKVK